MNLLPTLRVTRILTVSPTTAVPTPLVAGVVDSLAVDDPITMTIATAMTMDTATVSRRKLLAASKGGNRAPTLMKRCQGESKEQHSRWI